MITQHLNAEGKLQSNFDRLTTLAETSFSTKLNTAKCIACGKPYTDPIEVEYLKHNRYCIGCEQVSTDVQGDK